MTDGIFITGTDTGVGKTVVAMAIASTLRRRGYRVGVMKPVESGCARQNGQLIGQDAQLLVEASGCTAPIEQVNPYALELPLAPALAAEREGRAIDMAVIQSCFAGIAAHHDVTVVEAAGGLLSPFAGSLTMRDLGRALGLPTVIVVANALGAINHAALTVEAAERVGLPILGLVLNDTREDPDEATRTNAASLVRWGGAPLIGHVPYIRVGDFLAMARAGDEIVDRLHDLFPRPRDAANSTQGENR